VLLILSVVTNHERARVSAGRPRQGDRSSPSKFDQSEVLPRNRASRRRSECFRCALLNKLVSAGDRSAITPSSEGFVRRDRSLGHPSAIDLELPTSNALRGALSLHPLWLIVSDTLTSSSEKVSDALCRVKRYLVHTYSERTREARRLVCRGLDRETPRGHHGMWRPSYQLSH